MKSKGTNKEETGVNPALSWAQEHQGSAYAWNVSAMTLNSAMISSRVFVPCTTLSRVRELTVLEDRSSSPTTSM